MSEGSERTSCEALEPRRMLTVAGYYSYQMDTEPDSDASPEWTPSADAIYQTHTSESVSLTLHLRSSPGHSLLWLAGAFAGNFTNENGDTEQVQIKVDGQTVVDRTVDNWQDYDQDVFEVRLPHTGDTVTVAFQVSGLESNDSWSFAQLGVSAYPANIQVSSETLTVGEKDKVHVTVTDDTGAPIPGVSLDGISSDANVFSVDSAGTTNAEGKADVVLKGVAAGSAILNVIDNKGASGQVALTVGHHQLYTPASFSIHAGEHTLTAFVVRKANNHFAGNVEITLTDLGASNGTGTGYVEMDETSVTTAANGLAYAHIFGKKPTNGFTERFKAVVAMDPEVVVNPISIEVRPVTVTWDVPQSSICHTNQNGGAINLTCTVTDSGTGAPVEGITVWLARGGYSATGLINFSGATESDSNGKATFTITGTLSAGEHYSSGWTIILRVDGDATVRNERPIIVDDN